MFNLYGDTVQLPCQLDKYGSFEYWYITPVYTKSLLWDGIPLLRPVTEVFQKPKVFWYQINSAYSEGIVVLIDEKGEYSFVPKDKPLTSLFFQYKNYHKNFFYKQREAELFMEYLEKRYHVPEFNGSIKSKEIIYEKYDCVLNVAERWFELDATR